MWSLIMFFCSRHIIYLHSCWMNKNALIEAQHVLNSDCFMICTRVNCNSNKQFFLIFLHTKNRSTYNGLTKRTVWWPMFFFANSTTLLNCAHERVWLVTSYRGSSQYDPERFIYKRWLSRSSLQQQVVCCKYNCHINRAELLDINVNV